MTQSSYPTAKDPFEREVCPKCNAELITRYHHESSWVTFGDVTYALHVPIRRVAVILTTEGWHCRVCKHTWNDSRTSPNHEG